jgi:hypothetical protein
MSLTVLVPDLPGVEFDVVVSSVHRARCPKCGRVFVPKRRQVDLRDFWAGIMQTAHFQEGCQARDDG